MSRSNELKLEEQIEEQAGQIKNLKREIKGLQKQLEGTVTQEVADSLRADIEKKSNELTVKEQEILDLKSQLSKFDEEIQKLNTQAEEEKRKLEGMTLVDSKDLEGMLQNLSQLEETTNKVKTLEEEKARLINERKELGEKIDGLSKNVEEQKEELESVSAKLTEAERSIRGYKSANTRLSNQRDALKKQNQTLNDENSALLETVLAEEQKRKKAEEERDDAVATAREERVLADEAKKREAEAITNEMLANQKVIEQEGRVIEAEARQKKIQTIAYGQYTERKDAQAQVQYLEEEIKTMKASRQQQGQKLQAKDQEIKDLQGATKKATEIARKATIARIDAEKRAGEEAEKRQKVEAQASSAIERRKKDASTIYGQNREIKESAVKVQSLEEKLEAMRESRRQQGQKLQATNQENRDLRSSLEESERQTAQVMEMYVDATTDASKKLDSHTIEVMIFDMFSIAHNKDGKSDFKEKCKIRKAVRKANKLDKENNEKYADALDALHKEIITAEAEGREISPDEEKIRKQEVYESIDWNKDGSEYKFTQLATQYGKYIEDKDAELILAFERNLGIADSFTDRDERNRMVVDTVYDNMYKNVKKTNLICSIVAGALLVTIGIGIAFGISSTVNKQGWDEAISDAEDAEDRYNQEVDAHDKTKGELGEANQTIENKDQIIGEKDEVIDELIVENGKKDEVIDDLIVENGAYADRLNNPLIVIDFDENQLDRTSQELLIDADNGGRVTDVMYCEYDRNDGEFTIFVQCKDRAGNAYYNYLTFDKEYNGDSQALTTDSIINLIQEAKDSGNLNSAVFNQVIDTDSTDAYYAFDDETTLKSGTTTVKLSGLIVEEGEGGKLTFKTVNSSSNFDYNKATSSQDIANKQTEMLDTFIVEQGIEVEGENISE